MKQIFNHKLIIGALLLTTGMVGCQKKLDINTNPNQPTEDVITAEHILPNALLFTGGNTALGYGWLANWIGYWSASGSFNPSTEESSYGITNTFQEVKWANVYNVLFDLTKVEEKAELKNEPFYKGVAMVCKAHLFQNLVDIYGNIPYSQAFKPTEFPAPDYDDAKSIYDNLQVKLDEAIAIFKTATVTSRMGEIDIVFEGDTDLWIRFANTIKLRLLIRNTENVANPTAELAKIKAEGGVLQSGESADVVPGPGFQNDVNKQSPFFAIYGLLPSGEDANTFFRANQYSVNNFKARNDPRLGYFFKPAKTPASPVTYLGTTYGSEPDAAFDGDHTSNIGEGLVRDFDQPQWIVTSVESLFLQAEAVQRGWDIGSPYATAKEATEAAITESFLWLYPQTSGGQGDAEDAAADYLTGFGDWDPAPNKIEFIVHQKYLSLTGINPLEAWGDFRRLGIPSNIPLSVNTSRGSRLVPVRLLYPSVEFAVNAANVSKQGSINPQSSRLFWDKN